MAIALRRQAEETAQAGGHGVARTATGVLALGALGVVYGDIGTSPLYAVQAVFTSPDHRVLINQTDVYGVISLMFWSLTLIVSIKYILFVMRADDRGEGGILSLTALLQGAKAKRKRTTLILVTLGIVGASLFFGDGVITPAISVLSAVSGLDASVPSLSSLVVPLTLVVLVVLFLIQRFGTGVVGRMFGPVMLVWFGVLGAIGVVSITQHPGVMQALLPTWAARYFIARPGIAFFSLGAVVLCVTGAEALYADMGHFGRKPIRIAWFALVFPALTLNYLAQGSLVLRHPNDAAAPGGPFYLLFPHWAVLPMTVLATVATVIASQAVISGAFSVSQQAVQLGFLPRIALRHTSAKQIGQIYVPAVNAVLFLAVVAVVVGFRSSGALAYAYGIAVTGTFILNTTLFLAVARLRWQTPRPWVVLGACAFLPVEIAFFAANSVKVLSGGWLPLTMAAVIFTVLMTWNAGRAIVSRNRERAEGLLADFIERLSAKRHEILMVPGTAVFLTPSLKTTPLALNANVRYNHVLHDNVVFVSVITERVPHVPESERVRAEPRILFSGATGDPVGAVAERISMFTLHFGYRDEPNVPEAVGLACRQGLVPGHPDHENATYFLSQITIVASDTPGLSRWRKKLFVLMARNAASPAAYFRLPDNRTVINSGRIPV